MGINLLLLLRYLIQTLGNTILGVEGLHKRPSIGLTLSLPSVIKIKILFKKNIEKQTAPLSANKYTRFSSTDKKIDKHIYN